MRQYDINVATAASDVIAFRATELPMLIRVSSAEMLRLTMIPGRGMFQCGDTLESHECPGSPLSLAKLQIWREQAAASETAHTESMKIMMKVMTEAPAKELVAL